MIERSEYWYHGALIVASILYLLVEVVFNLSLMEAITAPSIDIGTIHGVEQFGRRASSTGFTLAVLGLFLSRDFVIRGLVKWIIFGAIALVCAAPVLITDEYVHTLYFIGTGVVLVAASGILPDRGNEQLRSICSLVGLCILAWPAFYYGKVSLTNHYLIDNAPGHERLAARYVTVLRQGLSTDTVKLQDVALADFGGLEHPEAKAFLVMLGPLLLSNATLLEKQMDEKTPERVVRALASKRRIVDISQRYREYQAGRVRFIQQVYEPYVAASKQYVERTGALKSNAISAWETLQKDLDAKWPQYQEGEERFIDSYIQMTRRAKFGWRMNRHIDRRINCRSDNTCIRRMDEEYDRLMRQLLSGRRPPPFSFWCEEKKLLGIPYYECETSSTPSGRRLAHWEEHRFQSHRSNAAGLPLGLESKNEYLLSPELNRYVIASMKQKFGLELAQDWKITNQPDFYAAFQRAGEAESAKRWKEQTVKLFGGEVEPGLSLDELVATPAVSAVLRKRLGADYVPGFNFSWSERAYSEKVIYPALERIVERELEAFRVGSAQFANGGPREEEGKELLQAALVPPIAVALSLLFSFLSAAKVTSVLFAPLVIAVFRIRSYGKAIVKIVFWAVPIGIMCAIPMVAENPYAESQAWSILLREARREAPVVATLSEYVIRVEPAFAAAGYPLMRVFDPYGLSPERR